MPYNDDDLKTLRPRRVKKKKLTFSIIFFVSVLSVFAVLGGAFGYVAYILNTSPDINSIMVAPKGYTTVIYESAKGSEVSRLHGNQNRIYVSLDKIPQYLQDAIVVMEDERFYSHNGIDLQGIGRAFVKNVTNFSLSEGASTLTQQLIKNNMLTNDKKIERKIREQFLALDLEKKMKKDDILELYLNTIPLGNRNVYGVQAAANRYFNVDVSTVSLSEATVIAAITQSGYYDPIKFPDNNKKRRKIILDKLLESKKIEKSDYDAVLEDDVYSRIAKTNSVYIEKNEHTSYFVDEVVRQVKTDLVKEKGISESQALNLIYSGGLSIFSTVDPNMQKILEDEYLNEKNFPKATKFELVYNLSVQDIETKKESHYQKVVLLNTSDASKTIEKFKADLVKPTEKVTKESHFLVPQPQSAMVIIDHTNGQVKAIVGGRGEKNLSQNLDRATQSLRQPGSTFKVLAAYAPAIDSGKYSLSSLILDAPFSLGKEYQYKQYKNWTGSYGGLTSIRSAIKTSVNIVAVKTIIDVGLNKSFNYLKLFGFTTIVDRQVINGKTYTDKQPGLALGGITRGVSLLELTTAYGSIANKGTYIEPTFYTKVVDHDGKILLEKHQAKHKVVKPSTAYALTSAMQDVVTSGTGTATRFSTSMGIAGKTGTTSENKDILFVGFTPYYTAGIWGGYDKPEEIPRGATSFHKTLWAKVMGKVHAKLKVKTFNTPTNMIAVKICTESGKLAVPGICDSTTRVEYFTPGTEPKEKCEGHGSENSNDTQLPGSQQSTTTTTTPSTSPPQNTTTPNTSQTNTPSTPTLPDAPPQGTSGDVVSTGADE